MKIWVDLANSPHPLLFAPVVRRLEERGHTVALTARDNAQTVELARERWPDVEVIGGPPPAGRARKAATLGARIRDLARWARGARADLALSHNSYAQIAAARRRGLRVVTAMDFEHQPANHVGFRLAHRVILPRALDGPEIRRMGASSRKTAFFDGLKEELYLGDFTPDPATLAQLGIARENGTTVAVVRTPPTRALYHAFDNPLLAEALRTLDAQPHVRVVVLTRHPEQREAIAALGLARVTMPERAVDSRSLMWEADVVLGAGGTMTREAALIGVPTFTLFAGREPAVDRWLMREGRLERLESVNQIAALSARDRSPTALDALRRRSFELCEVFVNEVLSVRQNA